MAITAAIVVAVAGHREAQRRGHFLGVRVACDQAGRCVAHNDRDEAARICWTYAATCSLGIEAVAPVCVNVPAGKREVRYIVGSGVDGLSDCASSERASLQWRVESVSATAPK